MQNGMCWKTRTYPAIAGLAWTLKAAHDDRGVRPCGVLERLLPTAGGGTAAAERGTAPAKAGRVVSEGREEGGGCEACSTADNNSASEEKHFRAAMEAKEGEAAQLGVPGKPGQYGLRRKQLCLFLLKVDLHHSRQGLKGHTQD
ncbi:MAG: hypothetical protein FRX49_10537 [Trebouxia sp. A1-2]|nr:MAG: hypothetical protein FRX49_10537 [Trebouxia sp. A1-2]